MSTNYCAALLLLLLLVAAESRRASTTAAESRPTSTTAGTSSWKSNLTLLGAASFVKGQTAVALTTNSRCASSSR